MSINKELVTDLLKAQERIKELKISEETLLRANDLMVAKNRAKKEQLAALRELFSRWANTGNPVSSSFAAQARLVLRERRNAARKD